VNIVVTVTAGGITVKLPALACSPAVRVAFAAAPNRSWASMLFATIR